MAFASWKGHKERGVNTPLQHTHCLQSKSCLLQQTGGSSKLSSLLRKTSELPAELITAIFQCFSTERAHLEALKFTTLPLRKAATRILHTSLYLNWDKVTINQLQELEVMPFIPQVRELEIRNIHSRLNTMEIMPLVRHAIDGIPHQTYFLVLKILSQMHELTKLSVLQCQKHATCFTDDILEIASQLPSVRSLHLHTFAPECTGAVKAKTVRPKLHTAEEGATEVYFPSLSALLVRSSYIIRTSSLQETTTIEAIIGQELLNGHIKHLTSLNFMIIERLHSLSDTWALVGTQRETLRNLQISMYDGGKGTYPFTLAETAFPHLSSLACWHSYHNWASPSGRPDDRALSILSACIAPDLRILGIGQLLLDHDLATVETCMTSFITRSLRLQSVLARHCQPPTTASDIAHENESQRRLRLNVEKVKLLFSDTEVKLLCLSEEDYDDYYAEEQKV